LPLKPCLPVAELHTSMSHHARLSLEIFIAENFQFL
jgi:hypothetical protein